MLVSIIINNHNYGRFLDQAINSALRQTYCSVEVIVVDDGSTDNSPSVIAGYGNKILPVLKANGGQASALNCGFSRSQGEVVIFLDADDLLLPDTAELVVAVFEKQPDVAKVHFRLEIVGAEGIRTGLAQPPWAEALPSGDLRSQVLAFPDDINWQPTSGNAFSAKVLRKILPIPEDIYRICADYYLSNLLPLFGPIISLDQVGGYYRVHSANQHYASSVNLEQSREIITRTFHTHRYIKIYSTSLGLAGFPDDPAAVPSVTFLAHRLVSLRLDPQRHPLRADNLLSVFKHSVRAALGRSDRPLAFRCLYLIWFAAVLVSPRPVVKWLAQRFFYGKPRSNNFPILSGTL